MSSTGSPVTVNPKVPASSGTDALAGTVMTEGVRNMGEMAKTRRPWFDWRAMELARPASSAKGRETPTGVLEPSGPWPDTPLRPWPSSLQPDHTSKVPPDSLSPFSLRPVLVSSQLPSRKSP